MNKKHFKKVWVWDTSIGRCVECDAKDFCHKAEFFTCDCDFYQHYKFDIKLERIDKLKKINHKNLIYKIKVKLCG